MFCQSRLLQGFSCDLSSATILLMQVYLTNSLTNQKELFTPLTPGKVGMYTCGPTVYSFAHIGNLRSYIFPDVLRKLLLSLGYAVTQVINITDVGHLTDNADAGEDKMEKAARQEGKNAYEVAEYYTRIFCQDIDRLNIAPPTLLVKATEHVKEMIALVKKLEEKGFTYRTSDGIYYDTSKFPHYGPLGGGSTEGLHEGARVAVNPEKRHPTDFALWKFSPVGEKRQMEWDSPWGKGFPGWHIECSAMSMKYLGEQFDIHTGGQDHLTTHHPNEIAQTEGATGKKYVNYWLHGYFLRFSKDQRMGKSVGNTITLQDLVDKGYSPLHYRYLCLGAHYRSYLDFSWEALDAAKNAYEGLCSRVRETTNNNRVGKKGRGKDYRQAILGALADDINTSKALGEVWKLVKDEEVSSSEVLSIIEETDRILSLDLFAVEEGFDIPQEVEELAKRRWELRQGGNYAGADELRTKIEKLGYEIRDQEDTYQISPS